MTDDTAALLVVQHPYALPYLHGMLAAAAAAATAQSVGAAAAAAAAAAAPALDLLARLVHPQHPRATAAVCAHALGLPLLGLVVRLLPLTAGVGAAVLRAAVAHCPLLPASAPDGAAVGGDGNDPAPAVALLHGLPTMLLQAPGDPTR